MSESPQKNRAIVDRTPAKMDSLMVTMKEKESAFEKYKSP
jgi:hypothetical protein